MLWIYGKHACIAALNNPQRYVGKIYHTDKFDLSSFHIKKNTAVQRVTSEKLNELLGRDTVHQGIALYVEPLGGVPLNFLETIKDPQQIIIILDQIEDPQNIGSILRSSAAFGAKAVIISEKNSPSETPSIVKTASGAYELVPIIKTHNINKAMSYLKEIGFWSVGFSEEAREDLHAINLEGKIALVMGNEGKGLRSLVSKNCDFHVKLPTEQFSTLNVSMATTIALYQTYLSQKKHV